MTISPSRERHPRTTTVNRTPVPADSPLRPLLELAARRRIWRGRVLGMQGEPNRELYLVLRGQVLLSQGPDAETQEAVELLGAGTLLGEGAMQADAHWRVTAVAVSDGEVLVLPAAALGYLSASHPKLMSHLFTLLGDRLIRAEQRARIVGIDSAQERLLALLRLLAEQHGEACGGETWLPLPVTQTELGQMAGLARETVARTFAQFENEGIIRRANRRGLWLR